MADKLLTPEEVAERLNVTPNWVRKHANRQRKPYIPCVKMGSVLRFDSRRIEEFVQECAKLVTAQSR